MNKEMSMEMRLLLAFLLMGAVLFVTPYFYKPAQQTLPNKNSTPKAATVVPPPEEKAGAVAETVATEPIPGQINGPSEQTITVDTELYHVVFSNRGAVVKNWILKSFKDHAGKPLDLVDQAANGKVPEPFSFVLKSQTPSTDPNQALFQLKRTEDDLDFEFSDGRTDFKKSFHFLPSSYLVAVTSEVSQSGVLVPNSLEWRGGFGDSTVINPANYQHSLYYDSANSKLNIKQVKEAKNGPVSFSGQFSFAGLEDSYFAAVFLPQAHNGVELTEYADNVPNAEGKEEQRVGAAVGGDGINTFELFVGPKDTNLLKRVDPKLDQLIDWGWFEVIAKPLFVALNWTAQHLARNYGWAIVIVTIAINLVLFPLRITSMKSSKKMQSLQPEIRAINDKYKGLSMRDPKKTEQNQEIMDLYKKHGVNPVGGCLPMLLQLPFVYAFYKVLSVGIQMRGANWLWVTDLSQPETLPIRILPVLLIVTQFLSQKMTPNPGVDPSQQKMMMLMPLMLGFMFYYQSSGLVLYWLTGNLVGIAQQYFLNKSMPAPPVNVISKPAPKRKNRN